MESNQKTEKVSKRSSMLFLRRDKRQVVKQFHIGMLMLSPSEEIKIEKHSIRLCDSLEYAKEGNLERKLKELFPELKNNK